jgi:hypothetical protein
MCSHFPLFLRTDRARSLKLPAVGEIDHMCILNKRRPPLVSGVNANTGAWDKNE